MSEWVERDRICKACSSRGPHLHADGMLFCGTCDAKLTDEYDPES